MFDAIPEAVVSSTNPVSLYGVFGYASIDVHMKWRETQEGTKAREADESMEKKNIILLPATTVPGIDAETGYFHVKFREGI